MSAWTISDPPTEADHLKACGLFGADLDRATRAIDKIEAQGSDRERARMFLGRVAACNILAGQDVVVMRAQGFEVDAALSALPRYAGVDVWGLIRMGRVSFADVLDAIEATS